MFEYEKIVDEFLAKMREHDHEVTIKALGARLTMRERRILLKSMAQYMG